MKLRTILMFSISAVLLSCSSFERSGESKDLSLESVLKLTPNRSQQPEVRALLGDANQVLQIPGSNQTAWIFNEKRTGHQKLALTFDSERVLQAVLWSPSGQDEDFKLENSQKRFPAAHFSIEESPIQESHVASDERLYTDRRQGILIRFRKSRQQVESVSWYNPAAFKDAERQPAIQPDLGR